MSHFLEEESSPWADEANQSEEEVTHSSETSPWGQTAGLAAENVYTTSASYEHHTEPGPDSSILLGTNSATQGLAFVQRDSTSPYGSAAPAPSTHSPRRARKSRILKKQAVECDPLGAPLSNIDDKPAVVPDERLAKSVSELSDVSLALEPDKDVHEALGSLSLDKNEDENEGLDGLGSRTQELSDGDEGPTYKLDVTVGDPNKIGDLANAHTVYTVDTVSDLAQYPPSASVSRRYRDFRWLYRALIHNNPGIIVPPPPEKQVVGRFNNEFVKYRRAALAQMLKKMTQHPVLSVDPDFVAFLTHEDFTEHVKTRVLSEEELEAASGPANSSGFISSIGEALLGKSSEPDAWYAEKRAELDTLEVQLRELFKALEIVHSQRKELSDSLAEFAAVTEALADVEPTRHLGEVLREFGNVHSSLSEQYVRQNQQDAVFLESTVDENLRLVNSVRDAYTSRLRAHTSANTARADAIRRRKALEKMKLQERTQSDKFGLLEKELTQSERHADHLEKTAETTCNRLEAELARVDREKVRDFRNSVEIFLENAVEAQKQAIELWETFYSRFFASSE